MRSDPLLIMIIEDDLIIGQNLKENLEELGYRVPEIATDWNSFQRIYQISKPDLCLVDISLKGSKKSGIEIVETVQLGEHLPVIYLTALDDHEVREKAKSTNPSAYLLKPASKKQIDVAIDFAVSNYAKRELPVEQNHIQACPFVKSSGYYFVKVGPRYQKLTTKDICLLQASGSSCFIILNDRKLVVSASLQSVLSQISESEIVRCHRSWAVNLTRIDSFDEHDLFVIIGKEIVTVPWSKGYKENVQHFLPRIKAE